MNIEHSIWQAKVRDYELDFQGIVNNAHYFHYLDYARSCHLSQVGGSLVAYAGKGINIVVVKTCLSFKKSLYSGDEFTVDSYFYRISKFKFSFEQKIYNLKSNELILEATTLIAAIDTKTGKPTLIQEFDAMEIDKSRGLKS